jgi:hypothetical protein
MRRKSHKIGRFDIQLLVRIVRMRADRAEDIDMAFRNTKDRVEPLHPRRNGDHLADTGRRGALDDRVALGLEIRKVQMAMGIDQHFKSPHASGAT